MIAKKVSSVIIRNRKIRLIVHILYKHESEISDGYGWYTGEGNVDFILKKIAKEILDEIELSKKKIC